MASHVRTTIRYDGPALSGHEMDVQDLAPALLALADIIQIANRKFNGDGADIKVLVNADVEQRCFQIDLSLVQSVLEVARGLLADPGVKTALDIARAVGIVGSAGTASYGLFRLVRWLTTRPKAEGTRLQVTTEGGMTTLVDGDGATITVNQNVYLLAADPAVIDRVKRVVQPLQKPGYETLQFVEDGEVIETVTREDARLASELPSTVLDPSHEDVSTIRAHVRIKSPQYEGAAKWSVLWGGRAIDVTMEPEFVRGFQDNEIEAPPNTILDVEMVQRIALDDDGRAVGSPTFTVKVIHGLTLPPKRGKQLDMLNPDVDI